MAGRLGWHGMIMITLRSFYLLGQYHNYQGYYILLVIILLYVDCLVPVAHSLIASLNQTVSLEPCDLTNLLLVTGLACCMR